MGFPSVVVNIRSTLQRMSKAVAKYIKMITYSSFRVVVGDRRGRLGYCRGAILWHNLFLLQLVLFLNLMNELPHEVEDARVVLEAAASIGLDAEVSLHDIFVRAAYADNPRVLREEMIHVAQGRAGQISSDRIVANEIAAREMMIRHAAAWGITADEVAEMQREIVIMRRTERY